MTAQDVLVMGKLLVIVASNVASAVILALLLRKRK